MFSIFLFLLALIRNVANSAPSGASKPPAPLVKPSQYAKRCSVSAEAPWGKVGNSGLAAIQHRQRQPRDSQITRSSMERY